MEKRHTRCVKSTSQDTAVAQRCARLRVPDKRGERDARIVATVLVHGMTVQKELLIVNRDRLVADLAALQFKDFLLNDNTAMWIRERPF